MAVLPPLKDTLEEQGRKQSPSFKLPEGIIPLTMEEALDLDYRPPQTEDIGALPVPLIEPETEMETGTITRRVPALPAVTLGVEKEDPWAAVLGKSVMGGIATTVRGITHGLGRLFIETLGGKEAWESTGLIKDMMLNKNNPIGIAAEAIRTAPDYWRPNVGTSRAKELASMAVHSLPVSLAAFILTIKTGGIAPGLSLLGATTLGQKYEELREGGASGIETSQPGALLGGSIAAASEVLTELPVLRAFKTPSNLLGKTVAASLYKYAMNVLYPEMIGEQVNTIVNSMIDKVTIRPDMTWRDYFKDAVDTAIVTAGMVGMQGVIAHPIIKQEVTRMKKEWGDTVNNTQAPLEERILALSYLGQSIEDRNYANTWTQEAINALKEGRKVDLSTMEPIAPPINILARGRPIEGTPGTVTDEMLAAYEAARQTTPIEPAPLTPTPASPRDISPVGDAFDVLNYPENELYREQEAKKKAYEDYLESLDLRGSISTPISPKPLTPIETPPIEITPSMDRSENTFIFKALTKLGYNKEDISRLSEKEAMVIISNKKTKSILPSLDERIAADLDIYRQEKQVAPPIPDTTLDTQPPKVDKEVKDKQPVELELFVGKFKSELAKLNTLDLTKQAQTKVAALTYEAASLSSNLENFNSKRAKEVLKALSKITLKTIAPESKPVLPKIALPKTKPKDKITLKDKIKTLKKVQTPKDKIKTQREQQLEGTMINAINTEEAVDLLLANKSIETHIKEGIDAGLQPEVISNNINELLDIQYAKETNPIQQINYLKAKKKLNKDVSDAFEKSLTEVKPTALEDAARERLGKRVEAVLEKKSKGLQPQKKVKSSIKQRNMFNSITELKNDIKKELEGHSKAIIENIEKKMGFIPFVDMTSSTDLLETTHKKLTNLYESIPPKIKPTKLRSKLKEIRTQPQSIVDKLSPVKESQDEKIINDERIRTMLHEAYSDMDMGLTTDEITIRTEAKMAAMSSIERSRRLKTLAEAEKPEYSITYTTKDGKTQSFTPKEYLTIFKALSMLPAGSIIEGSNTLSEHLKNISEKDLRKYGLTTYLIGKLGNFSVQGQHKMLKDMAGLYYASEILINPNVINLNETVSHEVAHAGMTMLRAIKDIESLKIINNIYKNNEEAMAKAFSRFWKAKTEGRISPLVPKSLHPVFEKILNLFDKLHSWFKGYGFTENPANKIFGKIYSGALKAEFERTRLGPSQDVFAKYKEPDVKEFFNSVISKRTTSQEDFEKLKKDMNDKFKETTEFNPTSTEGDLDLSKVPKWGEATKLPEWDKMNDEQKRQYVVSKPYFELTPEQQQFAGRLFMDDSGDVSFSLVSSITQTMEHLPSDIKETWEGRLTDLKIVRRTLGNPSYIAQFFNSGSKNFNKFMDVMRHKIQFNNNLNAELMADNKIRKAGGDIDFSSPETQHLLYRANKDSVERVQTLYILAGHHDKIGVHVTNDTVKLLPKNIQDAWAKLTPEDKILYEELRESFKYAGNKQIDTFEDLIYRPYADKVWISQLKNLVYDSKDFSELAELKNIRNEKNREAQDIPLRTYIQGNYSLSKVVRSIINSVSEENIPKLIGAANHLMPIQKELKGYRDTVNNAGTYYPRIRKEGDHKIIGMENDKVVDVTMGRTVMEANRIKRERQKLYPNAKFKIVYEAATGVSAIFGEVSPSAINEYVEQALNALEKTKVLTETEGDNVRDALTDALNKLILAKGFRRHFIERSEANPTGYEILSIKEVFSLYMAGTSGLISKMTSVYDFYDAIKEMDAIKHPKLYDYSTKYMRDMLRNTTEADRVVGFFRATVFVWYLGLSIRGALAQLTQNPILGFVELGRIKRSLGLKGLGDTAYIKAMFDIGASKLLSRLSAEERQILHRGSKDGTTDAIAIDFIRGISLTNMGTIMNKISNLIAFPFSHMEIFNRKSALIAGYRTYKEAGFSNEEAYKKAVELVHIVHFEYGKHNLPDILRGEGVMSQAGRMFYTFRAFPHNYLLYLGKHLNTKDFGVVMHSMAYMSLLGGMFAIPFLDDILDWAERHWGTPYRTNIKRAMKNVGGETFANFGVKGLPAIFNGDISGSLKINLMGADVNSMLFGVYKGLYDKAVLAQDNLLKGHYVRAIEHASPTFMTNVLKANREYTEGVTTGAGRPITDLEGKPFKASLREALQMGITGIRSAERSEIAEAHRGMSNIQAYYANWRKKIYDTYKHAKTPEQREEVRKDRYQYNLKSIPHRKYVPRITNSMLRKISKTPDDKKFRSFVRSYEI